jgi:hypothetical protein
MQLWVTNRITRGVEDEIRIPVHARVVRTSRKKAGTCKSSPLIPTSPLTGAISVLECWSTVLWWNSGIADYWLAIVITSDRPLQAKGLLHFCQAFVIGPCCGLDTFRDAGD